MKCCSTSSSATDSQDRGVLMNYLVPEIMLNIRFASRLVVDVRMNPLQWCIYIILNYRIGYHQVWESVFLLGWFDSLNCEKVRYPHCCNILCQHMRCGHFWGQIWKPGHTTIYHHLSCFLLGEQCPFWRHDGYPGSGTCAHLNKCWQLLDFLLAQSQEAMLLPTSIWSWSGSSWMVIIVPTIINHLWLPIPEVGQ